MIKYLALIVAFFVYQYADAQSVVFVPQWSAQTQFAGYYVAQANGMYEDQGLDVQIVHPTMSEKSMSFLQSGKAQFITLTLSQALRCKMQGIDLVNVMQTSQVNSHILVGHLPLDSPKSLNNRKLAVLTYLGLDLPREILAQYGLKSHLVRYNGGVNVFLSKAVDFCLMVSYNEYLQLEECGFKIDSTNMKRLSDWGYDMPEDGVYVLRSYYDANKDIVRKFVQASIAGWNYAAENQDEAVAITKPYIEQCKVVTNVYRQKQMLEEILSLQLSPQSNQRSYELSTKSFESALKFSPLKLEYDDFVKRCFE